MNRKYFIILVAIIISGICFSFDNTSGTDNYYVEYKRKVADLKSSTLSLVSTIQKSNLENKHDVTEIRKEIQTARYKLKAVDFWFRYLEPTAYKQINGPLPVEWETEVFEKFEKPYKREGAGLTLAQLYMNEETFTKDSLASLIMLSTKAIECYQVDSITKNLQSYHHFYLCNRLYLLNLASIYTTGFECPDTSTIIPELQTMVATTMDIYIAFNQSYPNTPVNNEYMSLYRNTIAFVNSQPKNYSQFDHFTFIKDYVNPLFILNQKMILEYKVVSHSLIDYSLNKSAASIFDKALYNGQNTKGIFIRVEDKNDLAEIDRLGKLLFYDPILSGNNQRSCASCHKSGEYFTDTVVSTSLQFDRTNSLARNTPTLINAQYNHLAMLDGKHNTLQEQAKAVITNPKELNCNEKEMLKKVLSCKEYVYGFKKLLKYTPQEPEICFEHIASALTYYYGKFSNCYAAFDEAIKTNKPIDVDVKDGFNLFMGKAQCGTCHFIPQFNGVKPPYIGSEFEVLGTPEDTSFKRISNDKGRYDVNPATETLHAFRTGTLRNAAHTAPYMHNGVFKTIEQVVDFYNAGGGAGRGLSVPNQTLSSDSLRLTAIDKKQLIAFIYSLNEAIPLEQLPLKLPVSKIKSLNNRKVGGEY